MEKPLHVRVAEALGCNSPKYYIDADEWHCRCGSYEHAIGGEESETSEIQRYDTDWSATGPLLEKYRITLLYDVDYKGKWQALADACDDYQLNFSASMEGPTPLNAACHLILRLAAAGKLKAA